MIIHRFPIFIHRVLLQSNKTENTFVKKLKRNETMKTNLCIFWTFLVIFILNSNLLSSQNQPPYSVKPLGSNSNITLAFLEDYIADEMEANHISGLAASIVVGDSIVWRTSKGLANRAANLEVEDSTLFLAYSVSKMFTAFALMQQYDKGLIDLDDNINDFLPFNVIHPQFPASIITFRMLLTHSAGITEPWSVISSVMTQGIDYPGTLHDFLENFFVPGGTYYSTSHFSNIEPGSGFFYSNVGAALAGFLVENISGIPFNTYCKDSLLIPMGMDNSSFLLADINMNNLAIPYEYSGSSYIPQPHYSNATLPAGFLRSSNRQMANFVKTLVNGGNFEGTQIISSSTLDTMTCSQIFPNQNIGLFMGYDPNFEVWGHTGGLNGMKTLVFFHKEEKWGVSLLTNGDGDFWNLAYMLEQYAREFSSISLSEFRIEDESMNEIIEANEEVDFVLGFRNSLQRKISNAKVILSCVNPLITIIDSTFIIPDINPDEIVNNEANPFHISTSNFPDFEEAEINLNYYENDQWIGKESYPLFLGGSSILLVDDEEHPQRNQSQAMIYYQQAFDNLDTTYIFRNAKLSPINQSYINQFKKVFWFTGISNEQSNILPVEEQSILIEYLNQGGNLFLSSQNATDFSGNTPLFHDYLKVNHLEDAWTGTPSIYGIEGDTISNDLQFFLTGGDGNNSSYSPSVLDALATGIPVFNFSNTNNHCGVRFQDGYKSIYLSFGIESVNNLEDRTEILNRSLIWFEDINVGFNKPDTDKLNHDAMLIYPNPNNGNFNIQLPDDCKEPLSISISDLSGKVIFKDETKYMANKLFLRNSIKLIPGVYLLTIKVDNYTSTTKLVITKE
jgi:CubicO group peptidase (beta-lactamase class C family)